MPSVESIDEFLTSMYKGEGGDSPPVTKRLSVTLRHPIVLWSAFRYVMKIPVVDIGISNPDRAKATWMFDPRRPWRLRGFILSYIELPSPVENYWRGTPKQNLRTRTSQARASGFAVRSLTKSEVNDVMREVFRGREWDEDYIEETLQGLPENVDDFVCVGVFDPDNHPVGFCLGIQTAHAVRTLWSCTSVRGTARWLCFTGYVEAANARGARFIIESPPWAHIGRNRIFAGHLGFTPARIRSDG